MLDRQHSDRRLGVRLTLATVAVALFSVPFVVLLVLVMSSFTPLNDFDQSMAERFFAHALSIPGYTDFLSVATEVFGPWTWRVLAVLAAVLLWARGWPRLAIWSVVTITASGLLNLAVKELVDRARPILPDPVTWAPGASFPSGHAMAAATGTSMLVLLLLPVLKRRGPRLIAWAVALVITVFVAYSRVALGVHWVSDVVAGVALGFAMVAATASGYETWRRDEGRRPAVPYEEGVEPEAS
ncbi:phosphatase PAP2 family protein [Planomonospora sp. ID67723]|uniref:phosphatase PAP2 family protein n=1 Tax=Planomonospora sp. ID67723 TaxID=2738134 RepID=UPI001A27D24E|nr:phosphatase PAP2 family protein [Planomonospora sp. ID67723]MBG0826558.1 phosphatase PAP2 family protein [Planomonospora sp. ID67723]